MTAEILRQTRYGHPTATSTRIEMADVRAMVVFVDQALNEVAGEGYDTPIGNHTKHTHPFKQP